MLIRLSQKQYFFFFRKEQAPSFISTPSSLLYPAENDNITLQWTYTLGGSRLDQVEVFFAPDSPSLSVLRVARYGSGGTTQVANDFQDRFVFNLTDSQSTVTIHHSQRSDSGTYELIVSPDDFSVKCKYIVFPYFLVETSTIILIIIITIIIIIIMMIIIIIIIIIMMMMMIVNMIVMIFTLRLVVL